MSNFSIKYRSLNTTDLSDLAGSLLPYLNIPTGGSSSNLLTTEYLSFPATVSTTTDYSIITNYDFTNTTPFTLANGIQGFVKYIALENGKVAPQIIQTTRGSLELIPNQSNNVQLVYDAVEQQWRYLNNNNDNPLWFPTTLKTALIGTGNIGQTGNQGNSVGISANGNVIVSGAPLDNFDSISSTSIGASWVFTNINGNWTQTAKLVGTGYTGSNIEQGFSVAISADGNTIASGAPFDDSKQDGAVWIFVNNNGTWIQQGSKLIGSGITGFSNQGWSVSLSSDGNTLAIGGPGDDTGLGATWIFTRNNGIWTQYGSKLVGTGYSGSSHQGSSVSLSADGNTLAIGGQTDNVTVGATWIFTNVNGTWIQQGNKLVGTNGLNLEQGGSVSLSADGNTLAVGATTADGGIWIFTRNNGNWTQQVSFTGIGGELLGSSVSLSADGNTLVTGVPNINSQNGGNYVYTRSNGNWARQTNLLTSNIPGGSEGIFVSISANGNTMVSGIPFTNEGQVSVYY